MHVCELYSMQKLLASVSIINLVGLPQHYKTPGHSWKDMWSWILKLENQQPTSSWKYNRHHTVEFQFPEPPREIKNNLIIMTWDFEKYKFTKKQIKGKWVFVWFIRGYEKVKRQVKNHLAENSDEEAGRDRSLVGQAQAKAWDRVQMWGMIAALCPSQDI